MQRPHKTLLVTDRAPCGRKTGAVLRQQVAKDDDGLDNIDDFLNAVEEKRPPVSARHAVEAPQAAREDATDQSMMDMDSSGKGVRLPGPDLRSLV